MANTYANPIVISSTFTTGPNLGYGLRVKAVYWYNPQTAGDTFVIETTVTGVTLLVGVCQAQYQSQWFPFPMGGLIIPSTSVDDFKVPTLSSGTLYIYYEPR